MAAELGYIDCCAVFLMVEIVEGQKKLSCCNHRWAGTAKWNHMVCPIILSLVRWPIPKNLFEGFKSCKKFQIEKADVELLQAVALLCRVRLSRVRYTTHIVLKWIWMKKTEQVSIQLPSIPRTLPDAIIIQSIRFENYMDGPRYLKLFLGYAIKYLSIWYFISHGCFTARNVLQFGFVT